MDELNQARIETSAASLWRRPLPAARRSQRWATRLVLLLFGRLVTVHGGGRSARVDQPTIFACNHNNAFETVVVAAVLIALRGGRVPAFFVDWMYVHLPVVGWLVRLCDPIAVYTKPARARWGEATRLARRRRSSIDVAAQRLADGGDVALFPESRRNADPTSLLPGRPGVGRLVLATGVEVVPIGLVFPAAARSGRQPWIGRLEIHIGAPLSFAAQRLSLHSEAGTAGADVAATRAFVEAVRDRVMAALASLTGKTYPWGTVVRAPLEEEIA